MKIEPHKEPFHSLLKTPSVDQAFIFEHLQTMDLLCSPKFQNALFEGNLWGFKHFHHFSEGVSHANGSFHTIESIAHKSE